MSRITIKTPKPKSRRVWGFNPVTRTKPSKKHYSRKRLNTEERRCNFRDE